MLFRDDKAERDASVVPTPPEVTAAFLAPAFQEALLPFERRSPFAEAAELEVASAILGRLEALGAETDPLPPRPTQPDLEGEAFVVFHVEAGRTQSLDLAARLARRGGRLVPFAPGADAAAAEAAVESAVLVVLFLTDSCLADAGVAAGVRAAQAAAGTELVLVHESLVERGAPLTPPPRGFDFARVLVDQAPKDLRTLASLHEPIQYTASPLESMREATVDAVLRQTAARLRQRRQDEGGRGDPAPASRLGAAPQGDEPPSLGLDARPGIGGHELSALPQRGDLARGLAATGMGGALGQEHSLGNFASGGEGGDVELANVAAVAASDQGVQEVVDGEGRTYFHNPLTNATGWTRESVSSPGVETEAEAHDRRKSEHHIGMSRTYRASTMSSIGPGRTGQKK